MSSDTMIDLDQPRKKARRKPFGAGEEMVLIDRQYRPHDLASLLESVMAIEAVSSVMPRPSSHVIESKLGFVKPRLHAAGVHSSGRIAKSRKGAHGLEPQTLQKLMRLYPSALPPCSELIWQLIRSGELHEQDYQERYKTFSGHVYKLLHVRMMVWGKQCVGEWLGGPVTLDHLRCLVTVGTLDAIAALWMLLIRAIEDRADNVLDIASHIPPALALFYRRPEGRRTAVLLFARMRKLILDSLQANGYELSLCRYNLAAAADGAVPWTLPAMEIPYARQLGRKSRPPSALPELPKEILDLYTRRHRKRHFAEVPAPAQSVNRPPTTESSNKPHLSQASESGLLDLPSDVVEWIERWRAPLRHAGRRPAQAPKWAHSWLRPGHLINQSQTSYASWGPKAIAVFEYELGDFF